jgi:hypothetical protein
MSIRTAFGLARLVAALICTVALVSRFLWGLGTATFTASNFFAYLTIQSNMVFVVVAVHSGLRDFSTRGDPRWLTALRAVVLSWTVSAGIVFAVLIQQAGMRGVRIDVPWSDLVLHFWLPFFALLDWLFAPGRGRVRWRAVAVVVAFPVLWGAVTMARGALVGWYPYFFLDPAQVSGPGEFALFGGVALLLFAAVACGVLGVSRLRPLAERDWFVRWVSSLRARAVPRAVPPTVRGAAAPPPSAPGEAPGSGSPVTVETAAAVDTPADTGTGARRR